MYLFTAYIAELKLWLGSIGLQWIYKNESKQNNRLCGCCINDLWYNWWSVIYFYAKTNQPSDKKIIDIYDGVRVFKAT